MTSAKKVIKKIVINNYDEVYNGQRDLAITLNDQDLMDEEIDIAFDGLESAGFTEEEEDNILVVIPVGADLISKQEVGGATEYIFEFFGDTLKVDLCLENEEEYIQ